MKPTPSQTTEDKIIHALLSGPHPQTAEFEGKHVMVIGKKMVVDTGADYTILPARYLSILGYNIHNDCEPEITYGVGGSQTVHLLRKIRVKLGEWKEIYP